MSVPGPVNSQVVSVTGSSLNSSLQDLLLGDNIEPGSDPSYQLCKTIYLYHPLGAKMAEAPITVAQCQERTLTVADAPPEVLDVFKDEFDKRQCSAFIHNVFTLSRVYGIASIAFGVDGVKSNVPVDMSTIWDKPIFFNVLDPLNTAGSMVLNQIPTEPDFNKPTHITVNGQTYHGSRYQVVMNEQPVYIAYTTSSFGYVGRSVYQRALFPLKSFIRTMIADDLIATKLALIVSKQKAPGSIIDNVMAKIAGWKRSLLKQAQTGNVITIDPEEDIETLDMQNVDGAGTFARGNILKNVATSADMPAVFLENETLTEGFGEGTEDAKNIARYVDSYRKKMNLVYAWFDNIIQYRAWNPNFFATMQEKYPDLYAARSYEDVFSEWRSKFKTEWPSLLIEPASETVKTEKVKLEAIVSVVETYITQLDPVNIAKLLEWGALNLNMNKEMFAHALLLDFEELKTYQEEQQARKQELEDKASEGLGSDDDDGDGDGDTPPPKAPSPKGLSAVN